MSEAKIDNKLAADIVNSPDKMSGLRPAVSRRPGRVPGRQPGRRRRRLALAPGVRQPRGQPRGDDHGLAEEIGR